MIFKKIVAHKLRFSDWSIFLFKSEVENWPLINFTNLGWFIRQNSDQEKNLTKARVLGRNVRNINKSKVSMNVLKVHLLYLEGRNAECRFCLTLSHPPSPPCCFFENNSKTTKLFALKFCDRYWPSLRSRYFWVPNRRGLDVGKLLKS